MTEKKTLYDKSYEHDACGVGFVVNVNGKATHSIVTEGITILKNLEHRGAIGGDQKTGDGAGMLVQIPHLFFARACHALGFNLPDRGEYGVGFLFLPQDGKLRTMLEKEISALVARDKGELLGWRDVPVQPDCLGDMARKNMPFMRQIFLTFGKLRGDALERKLYVLRRRMENRASDLELSVDDFYVASLSSQRLVYKGMFVAPQFETFYPDLSNPDFQSCLALVHQRYSTNTAPTWPLAHPFRYMAHNGEINTIRGNANNMTAREGSLSSPLLGEDIHDVIPIITPGGSDSAMFDNTFELLVAAGRPIEHAMMMMVPEAFGEKYHISADKRAFYRYHAAVMEPWDGPAAISFTDGVKIGAVLDRNGLRPARYVTTKSGKVVLASEVGVLDIPPDDVLEKGRLAPGEMLLVDTSIGRIKKDNEIKASVSRQKLYRRWLEQNTIELKGLLQPPGPVEVGKDPIVVRQRAFGYTFEDIDLILIPMARNAQEPIGSMGDDEALSVLSDTPQLMYRYFKQLFAQVTNPPIDPYRESLVMSLMSFLGREQNLLGETPDHCRQLMLAHPVLTNEDITKLVNYGREDFKTCVVPMTFSAEEKKNQLSDAVDALCARVEEKVDEGYAIIIISDRGTDKSNVPIPALLATSAINNHLTKKSKRHLIGLIVESGDAKEVMDFSCLLAFGADAINPYLAFETIAELRGKGFALEETKLETAIDNYITAIKKGLLKVMSKMGVSTIRSYKGAQIVEAIGLGSEIVDAYFPGVASRIEGIGIEELTEEILMRHKAAFCDSAPRILESGGHYRYRDSSEKHLLSPEVIFTLQKATREGDPDQYRAYSRLIQEQDSRLCRLRALFRFKESKAKVPLEEVEDVDLIIKRFVTPAMSFGSISKEAHETMAIAMNRLGSMSNSGEGGEDAERYAPLPNGDSMKSMTKQVASARFGVSSHYLINARELQIKMAQGAKPGEGGQLPGYKVDETIAKVRHSTPGVMLISPPPHHDIYSIEDLAQLIYDLKNANPDARISVKLVSQVGVGTVAAGVAKGKADVILISGGSGGTGASPLSSIKHAGIPWEIGLSETQQTLVQNSLRDKIRLQVDGQLRTGRDVVIGALLGAEEFGFGTISLISLGCIMMRKCHLNTCPVGVATQDPRLRKRFSGKPEYIMNFMRFVAQEVREIMAELGFRTFDEMVGQSDRLEVDPTIDHWKAKGLDFSRVLAKPEIKDGGSLRSTSTHVLDLSDSIDAELIRQSQKALVDKKKASLFVHIRNSNRAVGTRLSAEVSKLHGAAGLPDGTIECKFTGVAGQSFGAFLAPGVTFELEGDANDYLGKGLSGGRIILYPQRGSTYRVHNNIVTGNVNLFGAIAGEVFIHGMAGERFAVRNSGALAVVEGIGHHGCEYMTGGRVVILGNTGVNFAAGMSGGIAYVLDENLLFDTKCNLEMVDLLPVIDQEDIDFLHGVIRRHVAYTGSQYAKGILNDWAEMLPKFVKVFPIDYQRALERIQTAQSKEADVLTITEEVFR